jgi:biopolymer transport protein ExbB/TolQ
MQLSVTDVWQSMGPVAQVVMLLLLGMSVSCLAVAAERWLMLRRATHDTRALLRAWRDALPERGWVAARSETAGYQRTWLARLITAGTEVLGAGGDPATRLEAYDRTTRRLIRAASTEARRGLPLLATVGSTAPFVGLFGTVVGIVNAFQHIAMGGENGLGAVSSGIAEALVATALGIGVALPAVWLFNYLSQAIGRLVVELQNASEELAVAALRAGGVSR